MSLRSWSDAHGWLLVGTHRWIDTRASRLPVHVGIILHRRILNLSTTHCYRLQKVPEESKQCCPCPLQAGVERMLVRIACRYSVGAVPLALIQTRVTAAVTGHAHRHYA